MCEKGDVSFIILEKKPVRFVLTEGFHGLDQFECESLVSGQLLQHTGHLIMPRPNYVLSIDALYMIAHTDHLHCVHDTALFDALSDIKIQYQTPYNIYI